MSGSVRATCFRVAAVAGLVGSLLIIGQIVERAVLCGGLLCQLHYATIYSGIGDVPLAAFVLLGVTALALVLAALQVTPRRFSSVGRVSVALVCTIGSLLALRIVLIETVLLHAWSLSCVIAGWLSLLLLVLGIFAAATGHPRTRAEGGVAAIAAVLVATLSWHLMQQGGLPELRTQKVDPHVLVSTHNYSIGPASAKLQIVEFADFRCPPCRRVAPELRTLVEKYHGSIRLVQRELPNGRLHPQAERAAEIAECFGEQGRFWEVTTELYRVAAVPDDQQLETWIKRFGIAAPQFRACMTQHRALWSIVQDRQDAHALGVVATPTLFIGDKVLEGATSIDKLDGLLHAQIEDAEMANSLSIRLGPTGGCAVQEDEKQETKGPVVPCS
jgi:protein-disulfide isomerase